MASAGSTQVTIICFMIKALTTIGGSTFPPIQCGDPIDRFFWYLWSGTTCSLSLPPLSISSLFYLSYHILIQDENEEAGSADYEEADLSNLASLGSTQVTIICFMIYLYNYCICICDRGPTFPPSQCGAPLPRSLCFSEKDIYLYLWSGSYLPAKSMRRPSTQITF